MKLMIIFLKKRYVYLLTTFIILLLFFTLISTLKKPSYPTFSIINEDKLIKADLTGDGKEDILYMKTENNKYYLQVNTDDNSLYLEPSKKLGTVGNFYGYWPMRIKLLDISRDKIPEIFTQASKESHAVQHIFKWNNGNFNDIFCSNNNILGFIDYKNNKTPKVVSGDLSANHVIFTYYILANNKLESFTPNYKENFVGTDSILSFIKYIEGFPYSKNYQPKGIFYDGISASSLSPIWKMAGENKTFTFQDALFMDTKWDKDGNISEVKWILNFKGISNTTKDTGTNYTISVNLKHYSQEEKNSFKIYSVSLI